MTMKEIPFAIGYGVKEIFRPKSITLIGISGDPAKRHMTGGIGVLVNLLKSGYPGELYPVNPKYESIMDIPCVASIEDLPERIDLAIIAVKAEVVTDTLQRLAAKRVRSTIIISSGFAETGTPEGIALQEEIARVARAKGIRVTGPNILGCYCVPSHTVASTSTSLFYHEDLPEGRIAWVSQSGALCSSVYSRALEQGIGIGYVATTGNEVDLTTADFIYYYAEQPDVDIIGVYSEGIRCEERFIEAANHARENGKPVYVYKSGKTPAARHATKAHTASEAGDYQHFQEVLAQCGATEITSIDEMAQTLHLAERWKGYGDVTKLAVVAISGGEGCILADGLTLSGYEMVQLREETKEKIRALIPAFGSAENPVDTTAHLMRNPERIPEVGKALLDAPEVEGIVFALTTVAVENAARCARAIADVILAAKKPCAVQWYAGAQNAEGIKILQDAGVPVFTDNESFFLAMKHRKESLRLMKREGAKEEIL